MKTAYVFIICFFLFVYKGYSKITFPEDTSKTTSNAAGVVVRVLDYWGKFNNSLLLNSTDNPSYSGNDGRHNFNLGEINSPNIKQFTASYDIRLNSIFKKRREKLSGRATKGIGIYFQQQKQFGFQRNNLGLSLSRHFYIGEKSVLSIGLSGVYKQVAITNDPTIMPDGTNGASDPAVPHSGNIFGATSITKPQNLFSFYNLNFGVGFQTYKLYVGAYANGLLYTLPITYYSNSAIFPYQFGVNTSYSFLIFHKLQIKPELLITNDTYRPIAFNNLNLLVVNHFIYKEKFLAGIGIKNNNVFYSELGFLYARFRILLNAQIRAADSKYDKNELNQIKLNLRYNF